MPRARERWVVLACTVALFGALGAGTAQAVAPAPTALPAPPGQEAEPNGTAPTASPISSGQRIRAPVFPSTDVDVFRFTATAGDRVFATTTTLGAVAGTADTTLELLGSDGTKSWSPMTTTVWASFRPASRARRSPRARTSCA